MTFKDFNFDERLMDGLSSMGFNNPTPIQQQAIPVILEKKDLIACAQTGTGKTAAYLLPILDKILRAEKRHLNTLIIAPTRELAQQIDQQIEGIGYFVGVSSISVYGGGEVRRGTSSAKLSSRCDVVIATRAMMLFGNWKIVLIIWNT